MNKSIIQNEFTFKAVRSSGPGGQHVNRVSSKVVLSFNVVDSEGLREEEKELLLVKLASRLTQDNVLILSCDETRSQFKNKLKVIERCFQILKQGLYKEKKRKPTKPSKSSIRRVKENKKKRSDIKKSRRKPGLD
jgi:ribosome-associated protein